MNTEDSEAGITELDVEDALPNELEELANTIAGDWGGSIMDSRTIVLTAYKLGRRHEWFKNKTGREP